MVVFEKYFVNQTKYPCFVPARNMNSVNGMMSSDLHCSCNTYKATLSIFISTQYDRFPFRARPQRKNEIYPKKGYL